MDLHQALQWASDRRNAVLITLRRDGRAQSSDVTYFVDGDDIVVSVTNGRAKTANVRRDERVVVHVSDPGAWSYVSFDGTAALSPVAEKADDATVKDLVEYYRVLVGEHPDWDEYRAAMIAEGRVLLRFTPATAVGQINA